MLFAQTLCCSTKSEGGCGLLFAHGCPVGARACANSLVTEASGIKRRHESPDEMAALIPSTEGV